jgi:hypothetical protein
MTDIQDLLGEETEYLLGHVCKGIPKDMLHLPGSDYVDRVVADSDRGPRVLRNLQALHDHGRLGGSGYMSILPVDQGASTLEVHHSHPIPSISIRKTSSNWLSRGAATQSPPRSVSLAPWAENMPTRFRFWSRSITTSC